MGFSPLRIVISGVDEFSSTFNKVDKATKKTAKNLKNTGGNLLKYVTAPLAAISIGSTKMATDLNAAMANVGTLIPDNLTGLTDMKAGVQQLAIDVGKGTGDIAEGLYEVVSAFGEGDESMGQLTVTARAAKAGLATTSDALRLLSATTKGYGDTSEAAMKQSADLAFMTVKLGQTSFSDLASSMGKVVPIAEGLNISQKELFATYATLTGVTGNAAEVSTQMSGAMSAMLKPTTELTATVQSLGFTSASAMMKEKGLVGSLQLLYKETEGNSDAMAKLMGRKEGLIAALALAGKQADTYTEKLAKMEGASGALDTAFDAQTKGINKVGFKMEQAKQRIIVSFQKIGDKLLPVVDKILTGLEPVIQMIENAGPAITGMGMAFGAVIAAAGPLLIIAGQMVTAFGAITGAIAGAGGTMALLTNPIGWVILGVGVLIALVASLWDELAPIRDLMGDLAGKIMTALAPAFQILAQLGSQLWVILQKVFLAFQPLLFVVAKLFGFLAVPVFGLLAQSLKLVGTVLSWVLKGIEKFLDLILKITTGVMGFFGATKKGGKEVAGTLNSVKGKKGDAFGDGPDIETPGDKFGALGLGNSAPLGLGARLGGAASEQNSSVTVDFKNMPAGVNVKTDAGRVKLTKDNGLIMAGAQ